MKKFNIKDFNKLVQMSDIASISYLKETLIDNEKDFNRNYFLNHLYNSLVANGKPIPKWLQDSINGY